MPINRYLGAMLGLGQMVMFMPGIFKEYDVVGKGDYCKKQLGNECEGIQTANDNFIKKFVSKCSNSTGKIIFESDSLLRF